MAWRCRFMSASEVPKSTQKLVQPVVVAGLRRVSARHPAGSLRSTETTNDGKLRCGAATDLMGEVGGAFVDPRIVPVAGGGSQCGHHVGFGEDDSPPPSPACPEHPAIFLASAFCCAFRIVSLTSERTKKRWQEKQLNARAFARRGNCALGTQPPNPRAPPNTAPHLRSAGVVVVGLAASPAASAPIGHAAPPAAGAKGRPRQSKARRGLASFLKFEMTIMDLSDDASHNVA